MVMFRSLFLIAIAGLLSGCSSGTWGWYVVDPSTPAGQRNLWFLIDGLYYTIALSLTAILISIVLGLIVALPGLARQRRRACSTVSTLNLCVPFPFWC